MNTYHITWFEAPNDYRSKGENYKAMNPRVAMAMFEESHPNTTFISCISIDVLSCRGMGDQG